MGTVPTPSQTVGPFFGFALPFADDRCAVTADTPGAVRIEGQLLDGAGAPVPDGLLEAWQGDQFARSGTDPEGMFHLLVRKPPAGPDGDAPHLNVTVFARGLLRHVTTRLYFPDEGPANEADPVLGLVDADRRGTLVARGDAGVLRWDVHLQGEKETVFLAV